MDIHIMEAREIDMCDFREMLIGQTCKHGAKLLTKYIIQHPTGKVSYMLDRLQVAKETRFEPYICRCAEPKWKNPYSKNPLRRCATCSKGVGWMLRICPGCREPYLRDFVTAADYGIEPNRHTHQVCYDCNTLPVQIKRQFISTMTESEQVAAGAVIFRL